MSARCTRRAILAGATAAPLGLALASCQVEPGTGPTAGPARSPTPRADRGRLGFRPPSRPVEHTGGTGRLEIQGTPGTEPAEAYVPPGTGGEPLRVAVLMHGAGGVPRTALNLLREEADRRRLLLLAPKSTGTTWDVISGGYGPDVRNLDRLLTRVAEAYPVRGYTVGGFSDGASYALSLGLGNGDVFDSVIAFSPGFEAAKIENGRPRIFVSHGIQDPVLPIDRCSRRIVPALEKAGYEVSYHEFDGGHSVPAPVRALAVEWLEEGLR